MNTVTKVLICAACLYVMPFAATPSNSSDSDSGNDSGGGSSLCRNANIEASLTTDGGIVFRFTYGNKYESYNDLNGSCVFEMTDSANKVIKRIASDFPRVILWNGLASDGSRVPTARFNTLTAKFTFKCGKFQKTKVLHIKDIFDCKNCAALQVKRKDKDQYVFYHYPSHSESIFFERRPFANIYEDWCGCDPKNASLVGFDEIETVFVKGGTFTMGCAEGQNGRCDESEKPARKVTVSDFYISKYLVTQKQWMAVMGYCPFVSYGPDNNLPAVANSPCVPKFIEKLNAKTGKKYRLATEAEWEYAARGGAASKGYIYSGSDNIDEVGWLGKQREFYGTHWYKNDRMERYKVYEDYQNFYPVGSFKPNELGIYDMSGYPGEWVSDCYSPYTPSPQTDPKGSAAKLPTGHPSPCPSRVYRGAALQYGDESGCRVSARHKTDELWVSMGIRLVLDKENP